MGILAKGGETYAQFNAGPRGAIRIPVEVDFEVPFVASDFAAWEAEYLECICVLEPVSELSAKAPFDRLGERNFDQFIDDPFLSLETEKPWYVD